MRKNKKSPKGLLFKLMLSGLLTFGIITVYNHDTATATNEYSPGTAFQDLTEQFAKSETEEFEEYRFEENIASKYSIELNGSASYYADKFHARLTANGERFDMNDYSAAHKTLPFGTILRVTNIRNGKKTFVRINDRGPYAGDRILDLSKQSAKDLGHLGLYRVKLEGFKMGQRKFRNSEKDYHYGLSYDEELVCIPKEHYRFIDSTHKFGDAVRMYNLAYSNDPNVKIIVDASEKNRMELKNSGVKYYLGKVKESTLYQNDQPS